MIIIIYIAEIPTAGNLKSGTCNSPLLQSSIASFVRATWSEQKSKIMLVERRRGGYLSICEQQKITVSKESNFCWSFDFGSTLSQTDMCWELHSIFLMEALGSCHLFASSKFPSVTTDGQIYGKFYETVTCVQNFWILGKNGLISKLKHRICSKEDFT